MKSYGLLCSFVSAVIGFFPETNKEKGSKLMFRLELLNRETRFLHRFHGKNYKPMKIMGFRKFYARLTPCYLSLTVKFNTNGRYAKEKWICR
jgi:hypothetical protein